MAKLKDIHPNTGRIRVQTVFTKPTRTQQHLKDTTDINKIIARYKKTGEITHLNSNTGVYRDMHQIPDYETAMNTIIDANQKFEELPAKIREKFQFNPGNLISYLQNEKNREEAIELGLVKKPVPVPKNEVLEELKSLNKNLAPKKKKEETNE